MELLGVGDYFKAKVSFNLSNWFQTLYFQLKAVGDNWREAFSLPQRSSNQSRSESLKSASSPTRRSLKSHALLNSPVSSNQRRNFDKSERDRYFPTPTTLDGKFIQHLRQNQRITHFLSWWKLQFEEKFDRSTAWWFETRCHPESAIFWNFQVVSRLYCIFILMRFQRYKQQLRRITESWN